MVVASIPQVLLLIERGADWHGANAVMHTDEVAYSAYASALIRGQPRRNDPYTGREDNSEQSAPESLFSIQLVPAYLVAAPARWFGLTAANVFMVGPIFCAAASSLALFWFFNLLTGDRWLATAGVCVVLGFGTLIALQGVVRHDIGNFVPWLSRVVQQPSLYHLPFLRFYQPAVTFSLFFVLTALIWLALTQGNSRSAGLAAVGAGATFGLMVFSYFYLWTAAAAWLICICALWLLAHKGARKHALIVFGIVGGFAIPTLATYFWMLSQRAKTVDRAQALLTSHRPDLMRLSEAVALLILLLLLVGIRRRRFGYSDGVVLFTASLALTVLVVFNQQILTGRSLQPIHYEWFIANYCALVALVLLCSLWRRNNPRPLLTNKWLAILAIVAVLWAGGEAWLAANLNLYYNRRVDEALPVFQRLNQIDSATKGERSVAIPVVLLDDLALADRLPTDAPFGLLWAPRMLVFPGVSESENQERFFKQLYFLDADESSVYRELARRDWNFYAGLFPYSRLGSVIGGNPGPISPEEMKVHVNEYLSYARSFSRERAASPVLSYAILYADHDCSNLDRWYQRDGGERIGNFVVYRLTLR